MRCRATPWLVPVLLVPLLAGAAAAALGQEARITKVQCRNLVQHTPAPDVAYQPGVDVYGKPVVPADLDAESQIKVPREFTIDLSVDLFDRFGIPKDGTLYKGAVDIGSVTVRGDQAWYNGQPLTGQTQAALSQICRETYGF